MTQPLRVRRFPSEEALGTALRAELLSACASGSGRFVGLAVGRTTLPHYRDLDPTSSGLARRILIPVDELVPSPARPELAFAAQLQRVLREPLTTRVRAIPVAPDAGERAVELEAELAADGLCACVLGLGPDGHVAMNQPGSGPESTTRVIRIHPENLARLGAVSPADHALTLGMATILRAERVLLVVSGGGKAAALRRVLRGPEGADVPASWLRRHPACQVLIAEESP